MKLFIFRCNENTEIECLRKNLFGAKREGVIREVLPNSLCLLHNFKEGTVQGIWKATEIDKDIDPTAFSGSCPYQARVAQIASSVEKVRVEELEKTCCAIR